MDDNVVAMAALGIVATVAGAQVWLLKKLFGQNDSTIKQNSGVMVKLSTAIEKLTERIYKSESRDLKFQETVLKYLSELDTKSDRNYDAVMNQHVGVQVVEKQTVGTVTEQTK